MIYKALLLFLPILWFSCNAPDKTEDNVYTKINHFTKDAFDGRINDLVSDYSNHLLQEDQSFYFIDLDECAKCSFGRINNFFSELDTTETYNLVINDSLFMNYEPSKVFTINWIYIPKHKWEEHQISSSSILHYVTRNGELVRNAE